MGRRPAAPANDSLAAVPVFTTDPHGAAMFHGIVNGTLGSLGGRPVIDARGRAWHGWTAPTQGRMTGAANLGAGRPTVPQGTRLDQERGAVAPDAVQQIFEERMAARRFS